MENILILVMFVSICFAIQDGFSYATPTPYSGMTYFQRRQILRSLIIELVIFLSAAALFYRGVN